MLGAARDVDPAAPKLDEEEDVEPCRQDGVDGEEVAREQARRLAADELAPGDAGSLASGSESCLAQELADRRRREAESERTELARDALVAPAAVLARESEDQLADLSADRRSPRARCWVGPALRHELAMPADERVGRDDGRTPALAREEPARGGQERAVGGPKRGPRDLAPQDGELMTENDDLELLELLGAAGERDELKQASQGDVEH